MRLRLGSSRQGSCDYERVFCSKEIENVQHPIFHELNKLYVDEDCMLKQKHSN